MNIFKLMQHESHELKIIIKEDKVLLGCITCGEELFNEFNNELMDTYKTCLNNNLNHLCEIIKDYYIKEKELIISNQIKKDMLHLKNENKKEDNFCTYLNINTYLYKYNESLQLLDLKETMNDFVINELKKYSDDFYIVTKYDEEKVVSNRIFKAENNVVYIINKVGAMLSEEKNPTVLSKKCLINKSDFLKAMPSFDDEEEENEKYREFIYRMKYNLYDLDFLSTEEIEDILKASIGYFNDCFELEQRHVLVIKKMLNLLLGIYEEEFKK